MPKELYALCILLLAFILVLNLRKRLAVDGFRNQAESNAMVIVEPRKHKDLEQVLKMFDERMPRNWDLYIFHGSASATYAAAAAGKLKSGRRILLKSLEVENLPMDEYNRLLKDPTFWEQVNAENILVFQTDTALCGASAHKLDEFTKYDYIGCSINNTSIGPINELPWWAGDRLGERLFYGIGGLSFRKRSFMLKCIREAGEVRDDYPEDVFFSECVHRGGVAPPSAKVLNEFCSQFEFHEKSFGVHKTVQMREGDKSRFYEFCPEAKFLEDQA